MKGCRCIAALYLACSAASATTSSHSDHDHHDHDEHDHSDHAGQFEAAALYTVETGTNSIVLVPSADMMDGTLAFMLVPAASADEEGLEGAEEDAEAAWDAFMDGEAEATVVASGDTVIPDATVVYQATLDQSITVLPADVAVPGPHALLLEHGGAEVDKALISPSGTAVTADVEEGGEEEEEEEEEESNTVSGSKWAQALAATFLACMSSFAGIFLLISKRVAAGIDLSYAYMFATGAILTAALIHIIPEAFERFEDSEFGLSDLGINTGITVLAAVTVGIIIRTMSRNRHSHAHVAGADKTVEGGGSSTTEPVAPTIPDTLWDLLQQRKGKALLDVKDLQPICWNVIVGDAVHSFTCGFTIGAAFLGCGSAMGWSIFASTIIHEVPSEMADFIALLNGGMSTKQALFWNLLSGITAILGAVLILALGDQFTNFQMAIIFLLGAGSFIFIGLTELLPLALSSNKSGFGEAAKKLASFAFGSLVIGIPLIFHAHCHAGEGHEGHDH